MVNTSYLQTLQKDLEGLNQIIESQIQMYYGDEGDTIGIRHRLFNVPVDINNHLPYNEVEISALKDFLGEGVEVEIDASIRLVLALALAPILFPSFLDIFSELKRKTNGTASSVGGYKKENQSIFYPTIQTALFILAGHDLVQRSELVSTIFQENHWLFKKNILKSIEHPFVGDSMLEVSDEFLHKISLNQKFLYSFSSNFPASLYTTEETWDDLVLNPSVQGNLEDVKMWMKHYSELNKNSLYKGSKGLKVLFWGESGTGKTVSVGILGKEAGKDVYRIDLSQIVSKYVGETEKNLKQIFDLAQNKDWILFFDEGDALLGKRTDNKSANDRYGNQEIAYLLQRMEDFEGVLFLCTNKKDNLDDAFKRRFHLRFEFSQPFPTVRYEIWIKAFEEFSFRNVPVEYASDKLKDMNGAWIKSFARYCKVQAMNIGSPEGYIFDSEQFFRTLRNFHMVQGKGVHEVNAICKDIGLPIWKDIIM